MPGFTSRLPCHIITGISTTLLERLDQLTLVRQSTLKKLIMKREKVKGNRNDKSQQEGFDKFEF